MKDWREYPGLPYPYPTTDAEWDADQAHLRNDIDKYGRRAEKAAKLAMALAGVSLLLLIVKGILLWT